MNRRIFTRRPERELKLHANETIVFVMHRHVVHLLVRLLAPGLLLLLSATTFIYRALGGQFFVGDAVAGGQFGAFETGLLVGLASLAMSGWLVRRRGVGLILLALAGLTAAWIVFRLRGGRVLMVSPYAAQVADGPNLLLGVLAASAAAVCVYLYLDWRTDQFILTSHRVIYNSERPLVRRDQEQMPLGNIQQVEASTSTYLQHWLKFGTLKIKSAAVGFTIFFDGAYDPDQMQRRIMEQVKQVRRAETNADLRRLIESALEGKPPEKVQGPLKVERTVAPGMLQWLFPVNPEIDRERHIYTWRPHWFFLIRAIWLPLALWAALVAATVMGLATNVAGGPIAATALVTATLVLGAWAAWKVEDHRNDRYILTPTQVIDVSKRPFGPESSRTASLEVLQNVTYKTTLFGRIFGYGNVFLQTAGAGEEFTFYDAPRPSQMVDLVTNYQLAFKRNGKIRSLEDTVKLIQYYDAHYRAQAAAPRAREVGGHSD